MAEWNSRYVAYATAHGLMPDEMQVHDSERHPGGPIFILWNGARLQEYRKEIGIGPYDTLSPEQHAAYDVWLDKWVRNHPPAPVCVTTADLQALKRFPDVGACDRIAAMCARYLDENPE